jgi:hypothetical protein
MLVQSREITSLAGNPYMCIVVPASHPKSGLPCIYAAVLDGEIEICAVRFTFSLFALPTFAQDWSELLGKALKQMEFQNWVDLILAIPGEVQDFPYWSV